MKYLSGILLFAAVIATIVSCSSNKTYAQLLEEEQDAIHKFIKDNNLKIITSMPEDTVFAKDEFIRFSNDIYMNIVARGNLKSRPQFDTTNVMVRYRGVFRLTAMEDSIYIDGNWFDRTPFEFLYGSCPRAGMDYVLQYLADSARVRLIIPSKMGTSSEQSAVYPFYYGEISYIFEKP